MEEENLPEGAEDDGVALGRGEPRAWRWSRWRDWWPRRRRESRDRSTGPSALCPRTRARRANRSHREEEVRKKPAMAKVGSVYIPQKTVNPHPRPRQRMSDPAASAADRQRFDQLVAEEIPIQRASVAMEGGMPSCLTLFDNYLLCYCTSSSPLSGSLNVAHLSLPAIQLSPPSSGPSIATVNRQAAQPSLRTSSSACPSRGLVMSAKRRSGSSGGQSSGPSEGWARTARTSGQRDCEHQSGRASVVWGMLISASCSGTYIQRGIR